MANTKKQVEEFITPIVEGLGLEVVEVAFEKKHDGMNLTVFIDKKGGVTIEDCEKVHRAIDEPLDELDPTNGASYTLNVSSPGLDREIKTDKDFQRNIGEVLEVNLFKKLGACKKFVGELMSFDQDKIIIKDKKGKDVEIERTLISKATKYIEF
ncbi:MAG: ribosome maturation factor RimP [Clostridia bacterium]|nr:ribosome maturation factor RimP [Clostridia bacterium]